MILRFQHLAASVCLAGAVVHPAAAQERDYLDSAIGTLRRVVTPQRGTPRLEMFGALRRLRDESLRPFFRRLASEGDLPLRVEAILGLAELDQSQRIDPWLVDRLPSEIARMRVVSHAVDFDLIGVAEMRQILGWDNLENGPRIALLAELIKRCEEIDRAQLDEIVESNPDEVIRAIVACLLVQVTGSRGEFDGVRTYLDGLRGDERTSVHIGLINDIGRYRLDGMLWWIEEILAEPDVEWLRREAALAAALQCDLERGLRLWAASLGPSPEHADRVRHGLMLFALAGDREVPAEPFEALRDGELLTERIADAGEALAAGQGAAEALNAVLDLDHERSSFSAIIAAERLTGDELAAVCGHAIARVDSTPPQTRAAARNRGLLAIRASELLAERAPSRIYQILAEVKDDSLAQQMVLLGLLQTSASGALEPARQLRRIGTGPADALATILIAAHADSLTPDELQTLGMVAAGGAQIAEPQKVQAAWLYVKHVGRIEQAISQVFNGDS